MVTLLFVWKGLFSHSFELSVRPKKSDSGCYSLRSKTQPCDFSVQIILVKISQNGERRTRTPVSVSYNGLNVARLTTPASPQMVNEIN
jgi:hypothetical protein